MKSPALFSRSRFHVLLLNLSALLGLAAVGASAGTLTIDCSQGRVFIGYGVNEAETCLGRRDITIDGETTTESFTLIEPGNRSIPLDAGQTATIRARMDCATTENDIFAFEDSDVETVVVESTTTSGCQQVLPDLIPALLPEWNEELGISN